MSSLEIIRVDFSLNFNEFLNQLKSQVGRTGTDWVWVLDRNDQIVPDAEQVISAQLNQFQSDCLHFGAQVIDPITGVENKELEQLIVPKERKLSRGIANFAINYPRHNWPMIFDKVYRRNIFVDALEAIDYSEIPTQNFESLFNFIAFDLIETYRSIDQSLMMHYSSTPVLNYDIERSMQNFDNYIDRNRSVWPKGKIALMEKIRSGIIFRLNLYTLARQPEYNELMIPDRLPELIKLSPLRDLLSNYLDLEKISELDDIFTIVKSNFLTVGQDLSKPQKIAMVSFSLGVGGAEKVLLEHARTYHNLGFEIILITNSNLSNEYVCPEYITRVNLDISVSLNQTITNFLRTLITQKVDLVINHNSYDQNNIYYLLLTRLLNIRWVQWQHYNSLRALNYNFSLVSEYLPQTYSLASYYVCLTPFDVLVQKASGISNVICIPNPVIMKPIRAQSRQYISRIPQLLWIGRLDDSVKQISELPLILQEIVKIFPSVHLDIVGPQGYFTPENFENEFYRRGVESNVTFHGSKTPQELAEFYRNADLFIFTSITEGSPNVFLEASAYGLPIVMYELPWLSIAQNNLGCIQIPQRDRKAFSQSVVKLLNDPSDYALSSKAALEKVEELKRIDVPQMLLDLVHNRIAPPTFSVQEQAECAQIIARFIGYNAIRNSQTKTKAKRELDVDLTQLLSREAEAVKALIISVGDSELKQLSLNRQFRSLRKVRARLGRIKRIIVSKR